MLVKKENYNALDDENSNIKHLSSIWTLKKNKQGILKCKDTQSSNKKVKCINKTITTTGNHRAN